MSTASTAAAGTVRHRLSAVLAAGVDSPAEHTAWMAGHIAETFGRELHRADREELTKRLAAVEDAVGMVAEDLTEVRADIIAAHALDQPTASDTRAGHLLTIAQQLLSPLLALLRRLVTARAGGNRAAAANAEAAGRALDYHTRTALVTLALAVPVVVGNLPEHLAASLTVALLLLALAATRAAPLRAEDWPPPTQAALRRVLPTRAPPGGRAVTAAA